MSHGYFLRSLEEVDIVCLFTHDFCLGNKLLEGKQRSHGCENAVITLPNCIGIMTQRQSIPCSGQVVRGLFESVSC